MNNQELENTLHNLIHRYSVLAILIALKHLALEAEKNYPGKEWGWTPDDTTLVICESPLDCLSYHQFWRGDKNYQSKAV